MPKHPIYLKTLFPLSLFVALAVTACGGALPEPDTTTPTDTVQTPDADPIEAPVEIDDPDALPADDLTGIVLGLSGEGVLVIDQQSGKSRNIPFNTDIATAQTSISAALGDPTDTAQNDECGAGPMTFVTWANGFTINGIDDQFVGWTVRPDTESADLTTLDGVGLGSTLTELEENYDVGVIESSLGTEFNASNVLFGLLDANEADGIVTNLWAGAACNFR
ncbi:hypothetical protein [Leptothoe kymatousa]|uniref:Uncharacterized protein n=1 Tax=Leptothoe kymatousa TAU-MAC 1615 TaxID=2364775 RepID=A0ABS5Y7G1_9CYAN|nr:hypothetical protein [Leptothoe kymatousa]MBT9313781.1 hypothetical protein [Leptothoe kymatousa TAU-MAC 1615]